MAILYIVSVIIVLVIIIKGWLDSQDKTKGFILKPVVWLDLKSGQRFDVEEDFMNPDNETKLNPNTDEPYLIRRRGFMDKADNVLKLKDYWVGSWNGFKLYLNNISEIDKYQSEKINFYITESKELKNQLAVRISENVELKTKLDALMKDRISEFGDFSKQLPFFPFAKKK